MDQALLNRSEPAPMPPDPDGSGESDESQLDVDTLTEKADHLLEWVRNGRRRSRPSRHSQPGTESTVSPSEEASTALSDSDTTGDPADDLSIDDLLARMDRLSELSHGRTRSRNPVRTTPDATPPAPSPDEVASPTAHESGGDVDSDIDTTLARIDRLLQRTTKEKISRRDTKTDIAPAEETPPVPNTAEATAPAEEIPDIEEVLARIDSLTTDRERRKGPRRYSRPGHRHERTPQEPAKPGEPTTKIQLDKTQEYPKLVVLDSDNPTYAPNTDVTAEHEPIPKEVSDALQVLQHEGQAENPDQEKIGNAKKVLGEFNSRNDAVGYKILKRKPDWKTVGDPAEHFAILGVPVEQLQKVSAKAWAFARRIGNFSLRRTVEDVKESFPGGNPARDLTQESAITADEELPARTDITQESVLATPQGGQLETASIDESQVYWDRVEEAFKDGDLEAGLASATQLIESSGRAPGLVRFVGGSLLERSNAPEVLRFVANLAEGEMGQDSFIHDADGVRDDLRKLVTFYHNRSETAPQLKNSGETTQELTPPGSTQDRPLESQATQDLNSPSLVGS
jgi:hypothetical protein